VIVERAPDYFTPVLGWRVWLVVRARGALRLRSGAFQTFWYPREELTASCEGRSLMSRIRRRAPHETPQVHCDCGIHAAKEIGMAAGYLSTYDDVLAPVVVHRVIGRVSLWGSVVEGEFGLRAACAYPQHLYVPPRRANGPAVPARAIADSLVDYGVPVEVLDEEEHEDIVGALVEAGQWRRRVTRAGPRFPARVFGR
jgi:hypothetical protein